MPNPQLKKPRTNSAIFFPSRPSIKNPIIEITPVNKAENTVKSDTVSILIIALLK
jgi:hypothetical protein